MGFSPLSVQNNQTVVTVDGKELSFSTLEKNLQNGLKELDSMNPGQVITGEVVSASGEDVLLSIGENQLLRASLSLSMGVSEGQKLSFSIKSMADGHVTLSPLLENLAFGSSAMKALDFAGIPQTESTLRMVDTMMQEGMRIDPDSLSEMMKEVSLHAQADPVSVVQLTKLSLPVTEANLQQLQAYQNYEGQITEAAATISEDIQNMLSSLSKSGQTQESMAFLKELLPVLTEGTDFAGANAGTAGDTLLNASQAAEGLLSQDTLSGNTAETVLNMLSEKTTMTSSTLQEDIMMNLAGNENLADGSVTGQLANAGAVEEQLQSAGSGTLANSSQMMQAASVQDTLSGIANALQNGSISEKDALHQLLSLAQAENLTTQDGKSLLSFLLRDDISAAMKNTLKNQWLLSPDEVGKEGSMQRLYERMNSQLSKLSHALESMPQAQSQNLSSSLQNLSSNLDFMNQLNQMYTYVQLPLKMSAQDANGELYVYTNRKNLAKKDGQVSAYLHLTMEHLGDVDVHVSMIDDRVSTNFKLADDDALTLIADHIDLLNQRLEKRGYHMNAAFSVKGEDTEFNAVEEMLKEGRTVSTIQTGSFDARA